MKPLFAALLAALLSTQSYTAPPPDADNLSPSADSDVVAPSAAYIDRLSGANRTETSVAISQFAFGEQWPAETVYLARRDVLADALAAGSLEDGPILLIPSCQGVPQVVKDEINRLAPRRVIAIGGPGAICDETLASAAGDLPYARLAGANRYETSAAISRRAFPQGTGYVFIANGADSPDAVAGGVLTRGPVLLVPNNGRTPTAVSAEISRLGAHSVTALGGPVAVSEATLSAAAKGRGAYRLAGKNRYETAVAINQWTFGKATPQYLFIARADEFPDAVAAGVLRDAPILLVPKCGAIPTAVKNAITSFAPTKVIALGGPNAICDSTLQAAAAAAPIPPPWFEDQLWPDGEVGRPYHHQFTGVVDGIPPFRYSGYLGEGLRIDPTTGEVSGTPVHEVSSEWSQFEIVIRDSRGREGRGYVRMNIHPPGTTPGDETIDISAGQSHACAVTSSGEVRCWGNDEVGQLGDGDPRLSNDRALYPVATQLPAPAVQVSAGRDATCAVLGDASVWCWGQLGSAPRAKTPQKVTGLPAATQVSVGWNHACARTSAGGVFCWGSNDVGELGDGSFSPSTSAVPVVGLSAGVNQVTAFAYGTCALLNNGTVRCWGANTEGQLGNGGSSDSNVPVAVAAVSNVTDIDAGTAHVCAVIGDGTVKCWGSNGSSQLGTGTGTDWYSTVPLDVAGLDTEVASVDAGENSTCVRASDNSLLCWGGNFNGQLGDGTRTERVQPAPVQGPFQAHQVSVGGSFACATSTARGAYCWGSNGWGNLGTGDRNQKLTPTPVVGLVP